MKVSLHPAQSRVYRDMFVDRLFQNQTICASRGFGKSFYGGTAAMTGVDELLRLDASVPNKQVWILAPTQVQVTDIYAPLLEHELQIMQYVSKVTREQGRFRYQFPRGVVLKLLSAESIERLRGQGSYLVINDEQTSWPSKIDVKEAFESVLRPAVSTRWSPMNARKFGAVSPGRFINISTPKGHDFFYDLYNMSHQDPTWGSYRFDYTKSPYLDHDEIERVRNTMDPLTFQREYMANFKVSGLKVFHCFDRDIHVKPVEPFRKDEVVHVAIDFNVRIQATSAWAIRDHCFYGIEEFHGASDTYELAEILSRRFHGHKVMLYPDPSGSADKTSAPVDTTDFSILSSPRYKTSKGSMVINARSKAPGVSASANAVNGLLMSANGNIRVRIDPRLKRLIESMEKTVWSEKNEDVATILKNGTEHFSDGVRYMIEYLYPITNHRKVARTGKRF